MKASEIMKELAELRSLVEKQSADRAAESARAANEPAKRVLGKIEDQPTPAYSLDLPKELRDRKPGAIFARVVRASACADVFYRGNKERLPAIIQDHYRDRPLAGYVDKYMGDMLERSREKSMSTMVAEEGGLWVIPAFANDFITYLRPMLILTQLGARPYPMPMGTTNIRSLDAGSAGYWVGETQGPKPSRPKTGMRVLREKFAAGKCIISNNLLKQSSVEADDTITNDLGYTLKLTIEGAAFNGIGTEHTPKGLAKLAKQVSLNKLATDPAAQIIPALRRNLIKANVPMMKPGICFNADVEFLFYTAMDNQGRPLYREEMDKGTLFRMPYFVTNLLATGEDGHGKSEIYAGDWNEFLIGDRGEIEVAVSREGSYKDEAGELQSALENRETIILAHLPTDFALRHDDSIQRVHDAWTK